MIAMAVRGGSADPQHGAMIGGLGARRRGATAAA